MAQVGKKRGKYNLKARAERYQKTRQRIVEAAVELHRIAGPARTTVTDIANKAGVERQTVYNNPPPDPEPWRLISDPEERLRGALADLYGYYRRNERMLANVTADAHANPNTRKVLEPRVKHQERMRKVLAAGWDGGVERSRKRLLHGALWVALEFQTWRTLARQQGFDDKESIELMASMVRCLTEG
jgi:AcrR family transcriptional regulator